jgi:hypothetical protein
VTTGRRAILSGIGALAAAPLGLFARGVHAMEADVMTPAGEVDWIYLADTVMGGVSEGRSWTEDGILRLAGTVSTENRGGFIQARTYVDQGLPEGTTGLRLRVRGNGERYFVHLRTFLTPLPWQYYQAGFETGPDWAEVTIPLSEFEPSGRLMPLSVSPDLVRSVAVVAYGRDHVADLSVAALGPVSGAL